MSNFILTVLLQKQTTWPKMFHEIQLLRFRQAFYEYMIGIFETSRYLNEVHGTPAVKIEWQPLCANLAYITWVIVWESLNLGSYYTAREMTC